MILLARATEAEIQLVILEIIQANLFSCILQTDIQQAYVKSEFLTPGTLPVTCIFILLNLFAILVSCSKCMALQRLLPSEGQDSQSCLGLKTKGTEILISPRSHTKLELVSSRSRLG